MYLTNILYTPASFLDFNSDQIDEKYLCCNSINTHEIRILLNLSIVIVISFLFNFKILNTSVEPTRVTLRGGDFLEALPRRWTDTGLTEDPIMVLNLSFTKEVSSDWSGIDAEAPETLNRITLWALNFRLKSSK